MSSLPPIPGGSIEVSTARWPLIQVRFVGHFDEATFDTYLEDLTRAITTRQGPRVMLMDATHCGYVSSYARKRQAEWMRAHDALTRSATLGIAFALTAPLVRGALTAILWLEPLSCPYAVVGDEATAMARCRNWLEPHGLCIPERVRAPAL
jgi:hypothetical protein